MTVASADIFNFNTESVRKIVEDYVPAEGLGIIKKGVSIMHHKENTNSQILDNKQEV